MKNQTPKPNHPNQTTVSYNLVSAYGNFEIPFLIEVIRTPQFKSKVLLIHKLNEQGRKEEANQIKKTLPAATFSCCYSKHRCKANVVSYSGVCVLDADNLAQPELTRIRAVLTFHPLVYGFFVSPGGNGLKILVRTNGLQQHHEHTYRQVMQYFSGFLQIPFDAHCCDIVRLTFLSYDPDAYFNPDADVFEVTVPPMPVITPPAYKPIPYSLPSLGTDVTDYVFRKCVRFTNRKRQFTEGNRNNFVFLLSCYCRMNGLSREDALNEILQHYNFSQREIQSAVRSAYRYK